MALTLGGLFGEARRILNDDDKTRYTDADLVAAFNDALLQVRAKRPDAFIDLGLSNPVRQYLDTELTAVFPIDQMFYSAFIFYLVGRSEAREDTYTNEGRASAFAAKFTAQLLTTAS